MIPRRYITEWSQQVPWPSPDQVELDLVISRALMALFSDELLKTHLAFRGGTALHKLYLDPAPRFSEDIDLVQMEAGPIKPILMRIDEVITFFEEKRVVKPKANNNTVLYRFDSESNPGVRLRLKLEINCREHFSTFGWKAHPFEMKSEWHEGKAEITTYDIHELLGTKLRALYQRKQGRDLFDLYYADQHLTLDYDKIITAYSEYMSFSDGKSPTQKQFLRNLEEKENDTGFVGDLEGLPRPGVKYNHGEALEWVKDSLIKRIK